MSSSVPSEIMLEPIYTDRQFVILAVAPRVPALISLVCGLYMAAAAWQRRDRAFHRVILALSLHLVHASVWSFVGTWAIPEDTTLAWGASGTQATCSAQGFALQVSTFASLFYFDFLALHSYIAVQHNFDAEKIAWVEKWIHVLANALPLFSAIVLLSVEAFNGANSVFACYIDAYPRGCGDNGELDIPCERGPDNITLYAGLFSAFPFIFTTVFPLVMMTMLYFKVKKNQDNIQIEAADVARQASIYLGALYGSHILTAVDWSVTWVGGDTPFAMSLSGNILINLFGAFVLAIYLYFRIPVVKTGDSSHLDTEPDPNNHALQDIPEEGGEKQETGQVVRASNRTSATSRSSTRASNRASKKRASNRHSKRNRVSSKLKWSFNIFDGTNAKGEFADFVFEGDLEDEEYDQGETDRWQEIQDHV